MFYSLRFLLGLAEAGFFPGIILYLTYWYTAAERARIIALFMTATALSNVIGGPISGSLLQVHGLGLAGWQWLFLLEGLPAVLLGLMVWAILPDGPEQARWLTPQERAWLVARQQAERKREHYSHFTLRQALTDPGVWHFGLLYFTLVVAMYGYVYWLPSIIKGFGLSNVQVGWLTALPYLAAAVGMVVNGLHSDQTGERRRHVAFPALVGALGLVLGAQGLVLHTPWLALSALMLAALGMWATLGPFWALPTAFLSGTAAAGGIALINSVGNLGGFVGPYLVGKFTSGAQGYAGGLYTLAGALLLGGGLALGARQTVKIGANPFEETEPEKTS